MNNGQHMTFYVHVLNLKKWVEKARVELYVFYLSMECGAEEILK
jgi:hypothetical protein